MMADASGVAHPASRHDDGAGPEAGDRLALLDGRGEADVAALEGIAVVRHVLQIPQMGREDVRGADRERRVQEDRCLRNLALAHERREVEQQLLSPFDGEGGDQQVAAAPQRPLDLFGQNLAALLKGHPRPRPVAVGGFAEHVVQVLGRFRLREKQLVVGPDVAGKQQAQHALFAIAGRNLQFDGGRPEDVPGIPVARAQARADILPLIVVDRADLRQAGLGIAAAVDGRHGGTAPLGVSAIETRDLGLLDMAAVGQHVGQQIAGAGGAEDRPAESLLDQLRQQAGVIDMRVGQKHEVDLRRIEGEGAVVELPDRLRPLEQSAVHQELTARMRDPVAGAGDRAGRAAENQIHSHVMSSCSTAARSGAR